MSDTNKQIVKNANALLAKGNTEEFLLLCAEDVEWTLLADTPSTMKGREAIRKFMKSSPGSEAPDFTVDKVIAEGEFVVANGNMTMKSEGQTVPYAYCDMYTFSDGKIAELRTFINKTQAETEKESSAAA
ncbi:MAG: nuclear transport factor 2 family protein [Pyrinomonadaceae bacterium]